MRRCVRLKHGRTFDGKRLHLVGALKPGNLRHLTVRLSRTTNYNFGWLLLIGLVDLAFLLAFFLLLSSNFILQQGISISMPFSRFTLGPQSNQQIISITGGAGSPPFFSEQPGYHGAPLGL